MCQTTRMPPPPNVVKTDTKKIQLFSNRNSPQIPPKIKSKFFLNAPPIKIASTHIHIPRNNPAKFHKYSMDSLGGVADKRPLHIYVYQRNG